MMPEPIKIQTPIWTGRPRRRSGDYLPRMRSTGDYMIASDGTLYMPLHRAWRRIGKEAK